jgi:hypothetical protein
VRGLAGAIILALSAGCSTVIRSEDTSGAAAPTTEERNALVAAAAAIAQAPWPKAEQASLMAMMTGSTTAQEGVSRSDAADAYEAALAGRIDPTSALLEDAGRHLEAARALAAACNVAVDAQSVAMDDVDLVERGIAALREARAIYVDVFERLDGEREARRLLKRDFDDAARALSDAADRLAEAAMARESSFTAGPGLAQLAGRR